MGATEKCADLAERLTGKRPEPRTLTSLADVRNLLDEHGLKHIGALESVRERHPDKARKAGFGRYFFPPPKYVPRFVGTLALVNDFRDRMGFPLYLYNVFRPLRYSLLVSPAKHSAHINCLAVDFDTKSRTRLQRVLEECVRPIWQAGQIPLGIGVGDTELHIDIFARIPGVRPRPARWPYTGGHIPKWAR